jgi:hypothetical protein
MVTVKIVILEAIVGDDMIMMIPNQRMFQKKRDLRNQKVAR